MFICMGLAFWKAIGIVETVLQSVNKSAIFGLFLIAGTDDPPASADVSLTADTQGVGVESPSTTMTSGPPPPLYGTPADVSDLDPTPTSARRATFRSRVACSRRCTAVVRGRCGSTPGFADAAESNRRYRYLLSQGVSGLSVAFDLPTQIGYDSDHPLAAGEVGRVGVAIDSIEDMAALFDGIPLDRVSTSMTINATAIILLALYIAVAKRQGVAPSALGGTVQNDILKEYVARGTYIYPPRPSLRIVTDIIAFCERELPQWNTISISGYHIREAGSTAVQEVAFTLAHATAYVQSAVDAGLDVNAFGQRISFFFNAHNDFIEEIAKFRAARRLWARRMATASARPILARSSCASTHKRRAAR